MKRLLMVSDFFVSPGTKAPDAQLRARLSVFFLLNMNVVFCGHILAAFAVDTLVVVQVLHQIGVILIGLAMLFSLKLFKSFEKVTVAYICLTSLAICQESILVCKSLLAPSIHLFPILVFYGFLVCRTKGPRLTLLLVVLACNSLCFAMASKLGFRNPFAMPIGEYEKLLNILIAVQAFIVLFCTMFFVKIKALAQQDLEREAEWQLRSTKLNEISSLVSTLCLQMLNPLQTFLQGWQSITQGRKRPEAKAIPLQSMEQSVEEMTQIMQGFAWVYRSSRPEEFSMVSSQTLLNQLRVMLSQKVQAMGWTMRISSPHQPVDIHGPIPLLMLLNLTIIMSIIDRPHPEAKKELDVTFKVNRNSVCWLFSWPLANGMAKDEEENASPLSIAMRRDLIADLIRDSQAQFEECVAEDHHQLSICGPWLNSMARASEA